MKLTIRVALTGIFCLLLTTCSSFGYYSQSIRGQLDLMSKQTSITSLIEEESTSDQLRQRLVSIVQLRNYASEHLLLPENNSYKDYVALDRKYVVWNVFATAEFSLQPVTSCFVFVGCLQYKGFFGLLDAMVFAHKLRTANHDVFVGGVAAYSTLGWFDDPVLSSMLSYGEFRLAEVIFHELAHQLIYIKDDTAFNEAFATTIGQEGVRRWLSDSDRKANLDKYQRDRQWDQAFLRMFLDSRETLETLYTSDLDEYHMRVRKQEVFADLRKNYQTLKSRWKDSPNYDNWMREDLNNAKIASVVTYFDLVESFMGLLVVVDNDLATFYDHVRYLGSLNKEQRHRCLENLSSSPTCNISSSTQ